MSDGAQRDPWNQLKAAFRSACSRRLAGDQKGAVQVLRDEVPGLVAAWAKTSSLDPAEKKGRLKGLFEDESERAEELATIFELFAGKFESMVASRVARRVLKEVRPKLEEIVRESIVVEVPVPVVSMPEPTSGQGKPDVESESAREVGVSPEARELEKVEEEPRGDVEAAAPEPEPEEVEKEPEAEVEAAAPEPEPEEVEEEPEAEEEAAAAAEPEPPESETDRSEEDEEVVPEGQDEVVEEVVPGRISFDDIEGMIDNILDQTQ